MRLSVPSPRLTHFFTVDVEEYFQVQALESVVRRDSWLGRESRVGRSVDELLAMLARHGVRGTFFTLGWLAKHRPAIVRAIADAGHEIASHGLQHQRVTSHTPASFREDLVTSRQLLEDVTGAAVLGYRAPSFSIVPGVEWAFDELIAAGYAYDSSLFPIRRRGYGYPGATTAPHFIERPAGRIVEVPLATTSVLGYPVPAAGGGYLRQFPLGVIRRAFRQASERGIPATFYIHPWEIDAGQPRLAVSPLTAVRHYRGLGTTLARMERIVSEFRFGAIADNLPTLSAASPTAAPPAARATALIA
jgi:polysaccharide deacetylase family protein (PEP-CTERM system associated)